METPTVPGENGGSTKIEGVLKPGAAGDPQDRWPAAGLRNLQASSGGDANLEHLSKRFTTPGGSTFPDAAN
jgi:hypothetical protein